MAKTTERERQITPGSREFDPEAWDQRVTDACARTLLEIELIEPGASVLYHEGHLAVDMEKDPDVAGIAVAFRMAAFDLGRGFLVQKRLDDERCQYFFRRTTQVPTEHTR